MASEQAAGIGRRLRERREELGWTRRQLAKRLDGLATDQDIYRWETGRHKPQDDTLAALARALDRDYAWALGEAQPETPDLAKAFSSSEGTVDERLSDIEEELHRLSGAVSELVAGMADLTSLVAVPSRESRTGEGPS